jgi:hypothetical protein
MSVSKMFCENCDRRCLPGTQCDHCGVVNNPYSEDAAGYVPPTSINPGDVFNTPFEKGCIAITSANADGGFSAYDSDGAECWFSLVMVTSIERGN